MQVGSPTTLCDGQARERGGERRGKERGREREGAGAGVEEEDRRLSPQNTKPLQNKRERMRSRYAPSWLRGIGGGAEGGGRERINRERKRERAKERKWARAYTDHPGREHRLDRAEHTADQQREGDAKHRRNPGPVDRRERQPTDDRHPVKRREGHTRQTVPEFQRERARATERSAHACVREREQRAETV